MQEEKNRNNVRCKRTIQSETAENLCFHGAAHDIYAYRLQMPEQNDTEETGGRFNGLLLRMLLIGYL